MLALHAVMTSAEVLEDLPASRSRNAAEDDATRFHDAPPVDAR